MPEGESLHCPTSRGECRDPAHSSAVTGLVDSRVFECTRSLRLHSSALCDKRGDVSRDSESSELHCNQQMGCFWPNCLALCKKPRDLCSVVGTWCGLLAKRSRQFGKTPLHTLSRNPKVLAVLFRSRAGENDRVEFDINALDKRGRSALHYATSAEACTALFQAGFTAINALDDGGMSALHAATAKSILGVVRAVIEYPDFSQLNAVAHADYHFDTALSRAASLHNSELVLELLQHSGHDSQSLQKAAGFAQGLTEVAREKLLAALDEQLKATKVEEPTSSRCNLL